MARLACIPKTKTKTEYYLRHFLCSIVSVVSLSNFPIFQYFKFSVSLSSLESALCVKPKKKKCSSLTQRVIINFKDARSSQVGQHKGDLDTFAAP